MDYKRAFGLVMANIQLDRNGALFGGARVGVLHDMLDTADIVRDGCYHAL
jgi:hypothetical protein